MLLGVVEARLRTWDEMRRCGHASSSRCAPRMTAPETAVYRRVAPLDDGGSRSRNPRESYSSAYARSGASPRASLHGPPAKAVKLHRRSTAHTAQGPVAHGDR